MGGISKIDKAVKGMLDNLQNSNKSQLNDQSDLAGHLIQKDLCIEIIFHFLKKKKSKADTIVCEKGKEKVAVDNSTKVRP